METSIRQRDLRSKTDLDFSDQTRAGQKLDTHHCGCGDHGGTHVSRLEGIEIFPHLDDISWVQEHCVGQRHGDRHGRSSGLAICHRADAQRLENATHSIVRGSSVGRYRVGADGFEGHCKAGQASPLPDFRLVFEQGPTDFLPTRKWKFSFRAQHGGVFCCHNCGTAISKPSLGALRCLWPGRGCRIFSLPLNVHFLSDVFMGVRLDIRSVASLCSGSDSGGWSSVAVGLRSWFFIRERC